ncbi:hypothetical protein CEXT_63561 [Caerostris extrusa]|uniref:Uncharacterized protein n=1 Tax=Caerostris extrusa TaxID=172846 RepID=A0AAV4MDS6_CAEEX|nr:hypothetical protein CEXT_63561 [Caerostris extrusa]
MGTWFERTAPIIQGRHNIMLCDHLTPSFSSLPDGRWPKKPSDSPPFWSCSRLALHFIGLRHDTLGAVPQVPPQKVPRSLSGFTEMAKKTLLDIIEYSAGVRCPTSPSNNPPFGDCSGW